jgi:hypothetical protein
MVPPSSVTSRLNGGNMVLQNLVYYNTTLYHNPEEFDLNI